MNDEQHRFLALMGSPPARVTVEQAAWVLGCQAHDVPILIAAKLIKPLGAPAPNSIKYFSTAELLETAKDRSFLAKMTNTVGRYWQTKNSRKKISDAPQNTALTLLAIGAGR